MTNDETIKDGLGQMSPSDAWIDRRAGWLLVLILLLAGGLRVYQIGDVPLWFDEVATIHFAERPFGEFFSAEAMQEPNPPLYYGLARVWLLAFGDGEAALRSLPAVIGLLNIAAVFGFGCVLGGRRVGLVAALLLALSGTHLWYSQEARAYILLTLLGTLAAWATAVLVTRPELSSGRGAKSVGVWAWYVGSCVLSLYTHNTAVLVPAVCGVVMAAAWLPTREHRAAHVAWALGVHGLIVLSWLPWLSSVMQHSVQTLNNWHIDEPSLGYVAEELHRVYGQTMAGLSVSGVMRMLFDLPFVVAAALGVYALRRRPRAMLLVGAVVVGLPALTVAISFWRPILMTRTLLWPLPTFAVLLGFGVLALRAGWMRWGALGLLVAVQVYGLQQYYAHFDKGEPWDEVLAYLGEAVEPGDQVLVVPDYAVRCYDYYRVDGLADTPVVTVANNGGADYDERKGWTARSIKPEAVGGLFEPGGRVWVITRTSTVSEVKSLGIDPEQAASMNKWARVRLWRFDGGPAGVGDPSGPAD